ncbi:MAG: UvrD-helicase domain-containing protein [Alistipes sp.]|nr:UvrD-helicase domain-containing protein [Alistipes sp.]
MSGCKARILSASAGSGKTYQLAYKYVYDTLCNQPEHKGGGFDPYAFRHILAVTFTNKATEEMKSRILRQIDDLASGEESDYLSMLMSDTGLSEQELRHRALKVRTAILHDYSRFSILTNDTFFQRILRAFIKELGIEMNYAIELDTAPLLSKSVDTLLENISENSELRSWIMEMAKDRIADGKRWDIREGILRLQRELFKESTKEPISKVESKEELKREVFRYKAKADAEIERLRTVAAEASRMITEAGYSHKDFLRSFTSYFDTIASGTFKEPSATVISHTSDTPAEWFAKSRKATSAMESLASRLQPMLQQVCGIAALHNSRTLLLENYRSFALLGDLYRTSLEICREENTMLLSETKHTIAEFVSELDAPFIYEKVGNRFERYMIDEFQDTSLKEWKNFLPLLRNAISESAGISVLLVGDIKQSIYRWRGSDWNILGHIAPEDISQNGTKIERTTLKDNYRSLRQVVEFNNATFESIIALDNARLNSLLDKGAGAEAISPQRYAELHDTLLRAYEGQAQSARRESQNGGYISITPYWESVKYEFTERIQKILGAGYRPCDITILVRSKSEGVEIAQILLDSKQEIKAELGYKKLYNKESVTEKRAPLHEFDVMTQEALLMNNSSAVQFILAVMRLSIKRDDAISLAIYNRECWKDFTDSLSEDEHRLLDRLRVSSPEEAFEQITIHYKDLLSAHVAFVEAMHEQVVKFCAGKSADIALFLRWWEENGGNKSVSIERNENAIEIMTIHKAKGLENKVIIIPYCNWALDPMTSSGRIPSTIWAPASPASGMDGDKLFPVSFSSKVQNSIFAEGYYTETVYSHVDAINLLYVAFTRAAEQLHIFLPNKNNLGNHPTVAHLIYDAVAQNYNSNLIGGFELGTFDAPEPEKRAKQRRRSRPKPQIVRMNDYVASPLDIRINTPSSRYMEESDGLLSPRDEGIMLHRAFEDATTRKDIEVAVESLRMDGVLSEQECASLMEQVASALDNTIAGSWFDGQWQEVRRESNILSKQGIRRPDRVMIRGTEATVVDYKFGQEEKSYRQQTADYMSLLREMGYSRVRGFIWYVRESRIEEVV